MVKIKNQQIELIVKQIVESINKGNELIKVMVPKTINYESILIGEIHKSIVSKRILTASERNEINLPTIYNTIDFDELFDKKIPINGKIKINEFDIIIVDNIPYHTHDKYTTDEEKEKQPTLTNRINYLNNLYKIPIISISKTDANSELRISHFKKKVKKL